MYEEIAGLKELLNESLITEREFAAKKAELLGIEAGNARTAGETSEVESPKTETKRSGRLSASWRKARKWALPCCILLVVVLAAPAIWFLAAAPSAPKSAYVATSVTYYFDGQSEPVDMQFDERGNLVRYDTGSDDNSSTYEIDEATGCCVKRTMTDGSVDYTQEIVESDGEGRPIEVARTYGSSDTVLYTYSYYDSGSIKTEYSEDDGGFWSRETYDEDGYLLSRVDKAGYIDTYEWNDDHTELKRSVSSDKEKYSPQYYSYEYDGNGNVKKVSKSGRLYAQYQYALIEDCSLWAFAWAKAKPVTWGR